MTKLLLLGGLLLVLSMPFIGSIIDSELSSVFLNGPSAPQPTVDSDTPPRRYEYGAYVQFQTPQGPQVGYIEGFFWDDSNQTWSYKIQTTEGAVFENIAQEDITSVPEQQ